MRQIADGRNASSRGFTLVELLVVLAIITILTGIVFSSQSSFNRTLVLANTAYDVALSLRSAETYGMGGRALSSMPTGYGIHFDRATPAAFTLFADSYPAPSLSSVCHTTIDTTALDAQPGDCAYQLGQDVLVTNYTIGNAVTINDFCAYAASAWSCAATNGASLSTLDIVFARPDSNPLMSKNGVYSATFPVTSACLSLASPQGGTRFVSVSSSGQINANAPSCP